MIFLYRQGTTLDKVSAKARSGSINYNTNGTVHDIVKVVVNPRGRLGIFKVSPNFQFSNQVTSAYLPDAADDVKYKFGIAYGWGKTEASVLFCLFILSFLQCKIIICIIFLKLYCIL